MSMCLVLQLIGDTQTIKISYTFIISNPKRNIDYTYVVVNFLSQVTFIFPSFQLLLRHIVRCTGTSKSHYLASTAPLFSQLKVLDIYSISSFSVARFMHSCHHNLLPSSFRNRFLSSNQVHHYETRLACQYRHHF